MIEPYLSPEQVTDITGFKKQTLANWRSTDFGPPYVKFGRIVRYPKDSLLAWLESQPRVVPNGSR